MPSPKWRGEYGRLEGKAAHDQLSDNVIFLKLFMRLIILPVWLPIYFYRRRGRRNEMIEFTQSIAVRGAKDHNDVGLRWVLAHPDEYIFGEYDPKLPNVQKAFRKIMSRQT